MNTTQTIVDPRPTHPPEDLIPEPEFVKELYDNHLGRYIPQFFCQDYDLKPQISEEDWEICLSGPENEWYDESWAGILDSWQYERAEGPGCIYRYFIEQTEHGDLNLMKVLVQVEDEDGNVVADYHD